MYHNKRQKTASFTGTSSISQSIFTSLSHSAIIVTYVLLVVNSSDGTFFWRKTAILYLQKPLSSRGRPGGREPISKNGRNVGFLLWEFGSLPQRSRSGPVINLSSASYPQGVNNYGSLGVCERLPAASAQRAPGPQSLTIAL